MRQQTVSAGDLKLFCGRMELFLTGGVPLSDGVRTLAEEEGALQPVYARLCAAMEETGYLAPALEKDPAWPRYLVSMTETGEKTGRLEDVMGALTKQYAREERLAGAVRAAVSYPVTLIGMLLALLVILLWRVMPVFRSALAGMGAGASAPGLAKTGTALGVVMLAAAGSMLLAGLWLYALVKTGRRARAMKALSVFPAVKRFFRMRNASRLAAVLSLMLSAGFTAEESAELLAGVADGKDGEERMRAVSEALRSGVPVPEAVEKSGFFDGPSVRLLKAASKAGREAACLDTLAETAGAEAEAALEKFVSVLEPALVAALSFVAGGVLLSVMLPMAGLLKNMLN